MDRRDLDEIERFLASVGRTSLYAYYSIEPDATLEELENAVRKRRNWAQGQQSNPKYKAEALFLIKHNATVRRVLLESGDAYREHVESGLSTRNLEVLSLFIRGAVAAGVLTQQAEAAIHHQGRQLGLADPVVEQRVDEVLRELGARRTSASADDDELATSAAALDLYAVLEVPPTASQAELEDAYRRRYRWARSLKDLKRSSDILQALDDAWRVLKDPARRERYDALRASARGLTEDIERRQQTLLGLLDEPAPPATSRLESSADPHTPSARSVGSDGRPLRTATVASQHRPPVDEPEPEALRLRPGIATDELRAVPNRAASGHTVLPVPPPNVAGRTLGLADRPQNVRTRGPRLVVEGADVVRLRVSSRTLVHPIKVSNAGQGRMPGRVSTDRDWLSIPNPRLDPNAAQQTISVLVDPGDLPWGQSAGTVTVVTEHGERRLITIEVVRRSWTRIAASIVGGVGAVGAVVALAWFLLSRPPTPPSAELQLTVDPPADRVLVNEVEAGSGVTATITAPEPGKPFHLRIESDGFASHDELVTLKLGQRLERRVALALSDLMDWAAPAGEPEPLPSAAVDAIEARARTMSNCFPDGTGIADYTLLADGNGHVRNVQIADADYDVDASLPCIRRSFRGLRLGSLPSWGRYTGRVPTSRPAP